MFEESAADAWRQRFGEPTPDEIPDLARFLNHRSVRDYSDQPVPEALVKGLIAAAQSAATSSNLQLWSVVSVQDPARREAVTRLCDNQRQVRTAPWFLAFFLDHHRLRHAARRVGEQTLGLDYNEFYTMGVIDVALAAERLVCAAEHMGLGTCYIGALRNDVHAVKQFFNLPKGMVGLFGLCIGWPATESKAAIKPRLSQEAVWFRETYTDVGVEEYDERMRAFYETQNMKGDVTWSMRSGRRVDEHHLTGREALKPFLEDQGLDKR